MQLPPKVQKAAQESLKSSAEANLPDEQDDSSQQEQGTGRKCYDGSQVFDPSSGWALDVRSKKTAIRAVSANRGSHSIILPVLFSFPHLNLPDFRGFLSNRTRATSAPNC